MSLGCMLIPFSLLIATGTHTIHTALQSLTSKLPWKNGAIGGVKDAKRVLFSLALPAILALGGGGPLIGEMLATKPAVATDSIKIGGCLIKNCQLELARCILDPKCLANVICLNTCNNRPDETE